MFSVQEEYVWCTDMTDRLTDWQMDVYYNKSVQSPGGICLMYWYDWQTDWQADGCLL